MTNEVPYKRLRNVVRAMSQLDLDDPEFLERVAMLKTQTQVALVGGQPSRGNPAFDEARKIGLEKRRKKLIV